MHKMILFAGALFVQTLCLTPLTSHAKTIKVACVGDSITFGHKIKDRKNYSYPAQLRHLLGSDYHVKNFGVSGSTMLVHGNAPWIKTAQAKHAFSFQPDIVVIKLGTNDSKAKNWKFNKAFLPDTLRLIRKFKSLPSHPRVIIATPLPGLRPNNNKNPNEITATGISRVVPLVRRAAADSHSELIDLHTEFSLLGDALKPILPDGVHPNAKGAALIALRVADQILTPRGNTIDIVGKLKTHHITPKKGHFKGYTCYDFTLPSADNASCKIVVPKNPIQGAPWIWRARFFGHQPDLDLALLDRGYYLAYCDIANLFGSPKAVSRWNHFYSLSQKLGLNPKPILEGMSRGGLIIFNWAKANPNKVAAIYGDNPVCDIRSWPAKKSKPVWKQCLAAWEKNESDMPGFHENPIDGLDALAKADIPIFLVLGKQDKVVPLKENAYVLMNRYQKLGGSVTVWQKPTGNHHPHGLHPVFPLLRYLLSATGNPISPTLYQRAQTQIYPPLHQNQKKNRQALLSNSKRILILGDSISYAGSYIALFESWLTTQPFGKNKLVVNLGLPSETVSGLSEKGHAGGKFPRPDLHERLDRILTQFKPDLILACYGMNDGIYMPINKKRFDAYKTGIVKLKTKAEQAGAKIIFITPPYYDNHGAREKFNYANTLTAFSKWLVARRANGWNVIDLNSAMTRTIHARQIIHPKLTYQRDHIHPNLAGHHIMAQSLIQWFANPNTAPTEDLIRKHSQIISIFPLVNHRMQILRDAWLTKTKHNRPGIKPGLPLPKAQSQANKLSQKINKLLQK